MSEIFQEPSGIPDGYKRIQLGPKSDVIPNEWEVESISDWLFSLETGSRPRTSERSDSDSVLSIGGAHISDGAFDLDEPVRISEEYYEDLNSGKIEEGDILLVKDGATIGKSTYVNSIPEDRAAVNSHVYILRVEGETHDPRFLYNFIKARIGLDQLLRLTTGTAQAGLNRTFQQAVKVPTPPLHEQRYIADILSTVGDQIHYISAIIDKISELKKGLMQDLFTEGLHKIDKKETDSRYGKIPENWKLRKLKDIGEIAGRTAPEKDQPECWGGDIPWATPSEITSLEGPTIEDTEEHLTELALEKVSSNLLPPGSILLTTRATIGKCAVNKVKMTTNQGFKNLIPANNTDTWYVYYRLKYERDYLASLSKGSTFPEVGKDTVENFLIPVPQLEEQKQIGEYLRSVDKVLDSYKSSKKKYQRLKRGLMQDLLTGKVRVNTD
ncbi:restriction endonuclease subunit S [Natrinema versiforme]|uniref:Restriction modification system DNA specificity domain-containing protein n=1 Tax=Natrinema versiforme JCM 10478 TaxID=1227496 RepID=L9Y7A7_9EURY|nr:restriction endonuclease subunit S [Natrinema versiforme]ELY69944.1 restriction modification system DNA specificity domain-containing protein [Natrinema versiforme JCM 10478]